jgi:hypothetical protein
MEPIMLDTIAFNFPELRIIGAHLGIGYYDLAAHVARWRRNVFFDISGGEMVRCGNLYGQFTRKSAIRSGAFTLGSRSCAAGAGESGWVTSSISR